MDWKRLWQTCRTPALLKAVGEVAMGGRGDCSRAIHVRTRYHLITEDLTFKATQFPAARAALRGAIAEKSGV